MWSVSMVSRARQLLRQGAGGILWVIALVCAAPLHAATQAQLGDEALSYYGSLSLSETFTAVATGIRFEPYVGVLRGPAGTALARGGNAADQALLLADILKAKGYRVRFVRGTLSGKNLETLILGMYPPDLPAMQLPAEYQPFDPYADKELMAAARDHIWLELDQGDGSWLPLDPSFPRAKIGAAYTKAEGHFDALPESLYQKISVVVNEETAGGNKRIVGQMEARLADVGLQPLSITEIGMPRFKPVKEAVRKSAGDLFSGALSGDTTVKEEPAENPGPPQPLGIVYRRSLQRGGESAGMSDSIVFDDNPKSEIRREWLRFEIQVPGAQPRVVERDLFAVGSPGESGKRPAGYRRFSIVVLPGPIEPKAVTAYAARLRQAINLKETRAQLDTLAASKSTSRETLRAVSGIGDKLGIAVGHLLGLQLGAESSQLTRRIAYANGITFAQSLPRIIIVSTTAADKSYQASIDMRLDQVDAWPFPGYATRAAEHFQTARGIQNTMLEGRFIERTLGLDEAANTANLIARVKGGQAAMLSFSSAQTDQLNKLEGLSPYSRQLIEASLKAGQQVIIPPRPEQLAGRMRLGWWELEPRTGQMIGVMDDGLHSAMAEYSVNTEKIGLNDDTGFVIGMIVGATGTQIMLASRILDSGEITQEMIADIEKRMEQLKCLSCPEAEAKASASASVSVGGNCWEIKKEAKAEAGVGVKTMSFCEKYTNGMMCAAKLILNGYKGSTPLLTTKAEIDADASMKLPCQ